MDGQKSPGDPILRAPAVLKTTLMVVMKTKRRSPPTEAVMRKLRRAGDSVKAMEGGGNELTVYKQNRIRLAKDT